MQAQPVPDYEPVMLTRQRLEQLFLEMRHARMSPRTVGLLRKLATLPLALRTIVNLKIVLGMMAQTEVTNILLDGVTDDERRVLLEIAGSRISKASKETAHALFSMEARLLTVSALRPVFRRERTAIGQELTEEEIDKLVEGS